jgi:type I restriction-modification system specificity subunit
MEYVKLGNIAKFRYGKMPDKDKFLDDGYPVFSGYRITGYYSEYMVENPTLIVVARGVGGTGDVKISPPKSYITNLSIIVDLDESVADMRYLYYQFVCNNLRYLDTGAAQSQITINNLSKHKALLPRLVIQKKISSILTTYDNLIENNNKRIRLLEQMAENLYKEWFVRFRFPGYEDTEFIDGMPRDWVREKIGLHYNTCSGGTPSRTHEEYYTEGTIPWVKTGEIKDGIIIHTDECITEAGIKGSSAKLLPQGAVVMAMYGVNIGMLAYLDSEMTCNQACCVFNDKNEINSRHYLFHYLYSIRDYLLLIGFGAAQQNLSQDLIKKVKIVIPPAELIKEFDKQKEPLYQTIRALMMQNDKLIKQRDALLPRLMSGKLEV